MLLPVDLLLVLELAHLKGAGVSLCSPALHRGGRSEYGSDAWSLVQALPAGV